MQRVAKQPFERINRAQLISFSWNGEQLAAFEGDSLASALLANEVRLVGRSFKYGRRRGIFAAGIEEPNAITTIGEGALLTPNPKATEVELYPSLVAQSASGLPSLRYDVRRLFTPFHGFLGAGFYYKTFKWPKRWWPKYEHILRKLTGYSHPPTKPDNEKYDHLYHHCDALVVGGGFAGIASALSLAKQGAQVIVADERPRLGGEGFSIMATEKQAATWWHKAQSDITQHRNITLLSRTNVFQIEDGDIAYGVELRQDHLQPVARKANVSRQRLHRIRYKHLILATGAHERPMLFVGNDLPGVMLGTAVSRYLHEFAVLCGSRIVICTNNDTGYKLALDMLAFRDKGVEQVCVVDQRSKVHKDMHQAVTKAGGTVMQQHLIKSAKGTKSLQSVRIVKCDEHGQPVGDSFNQPCDLIANCGGFNPLVHLDCHTGGKPHYDEKLRAFVPALTKDNHHGCGSVLGYSHWHECVASGEYTATAIAKQLRLIKATRKSTMAKPVAPQSINTADFAIPIANKSKVFVDFQNDVTQKDIESAIAENYTSIEHIKRYTALGFGTDQGKTGNVLGVAIAAHTCNKAIADIGTTTFRPAWSPVAFGAMAGAEVGDLFDPVRYSPMHQSHIERNAVMELVGQWHRPRYFPLEGEDMHQAVHRECMAARTSVAVMDASTLGKIDIKGPDARELLNRLYTNSWSKLAVGKARYGIMCNENGMIIDDGVSTCLANDHFLMTTTTGGAAHIYQWIETWLQTEWPNLRVYVTSVTDHYATTAVVGPNARVLMRTICKDINFDKESFQFMQWRDGKISGVQVRIVRISFSGELAYEIHVQANYGRFIWEKVMQAGKRWNITPYGTEAMHVLRAEKGYIIVGQDTDGSISPQDAGMSWAVATKKTYGFLGQRSTTRSDLLRKDRKQFVGLIPHDTQLVLPEGCQLTATPIKTKSNTAQPVESAAMIGHITSSYLSPILGHAIALAVVQGGHHAIGKTIYARPLVDGKNITKSYPVTITSPVFYDPQGERTDGNV